MPAKWKGEPKRWRVIGRSDDDMMVTLGRHDTEEEAQADAEKFVREGFYREVSVERIEPAGDAARQDA